MKKLFYHRVAIYKKPVRFSFDKDEFITKTVDVLAENEMYIVLNDAYFTKLELTGDGVCYSRVGKESICVRIHDHSLGKGVFYTLYSEKRRRPSTIKRHIEKHIANKYGWLLGELDLSIIA